MAASIGTSPKSGICMANWSTVGVEMVDLPYYLGQGSGVTVCVCVWGGVASSTVAAQTAPVKQYSLGGENPPMTIAVCFDWS